MPTETIEGGVRVLRYQEERPGPADPMVWHPDVAYAEDQEALGIPLGNIGRFHVLPDGGVLLPGYGMETLHLFDADGTFLGSMGARGGGPGEYLSVHAYMDLEGGFGLLDPPGRRLVIFERDGAFREQRPLPAILPANPSNVAMAPSATGFNAVLLQGRGGARSGMDHIFNWQFRILRLDESLEAGEAVYDTSYAVKWVASAGRILNPIAALADRVAYAVGPGLPVAWSDRDVFRVDFLEPSSGEHWAVCLPGNRLEVDARMRSEMLASFRDFWEVPDDEIGRLSLPSELPAICTMQWDRSGRLWVETFASWFDQLYQVEGQGVEFLVFDRSGRYLFSQRLPFSPNLITGDAFYVSEKLEDGTPVLRKYLYEQRSP